MKTTTFITVIVLLLFIAGCSRNAYRNTSPDELKQVDLDFSKYAVSHGMNAAFLAYADSSAVLLRPGMPPVEGIGSMAGLLRQTDDSRFTLSWEPTGANISKSGDMGYTYGIYTLSGGNQREKGTYVTVWKRNKTGNWKFVLDTGNAGLGEGD